MPGGWWCRSPWPPRTTPATRGSGALPAAPGAPARLVVDHASDPGIEERVRHLGPLVPQLADEIGVDLVETPVPTTRADRMRVEVRLAGRHRERLVVLVREVLLDRSLRDVLGVA